jgi:hypothetical protein
MSTTVQHGRAIRAINGVGGGLRIKPKLTSQSLMDAAAKKTRLSDFGDESFRTGLDVLTRSLEDEADLTFLGRVAARSRLTSLLEQRLRLQNARVLYETETVTRPVFVLGLPRTGTTVLYGMLAANPALRSPSSWEVSRPFPAPRVSRTRSGSRPARRTSTGSGASLRASTRSTRWARTSRRSAWRCRRRASRRTSS